MPLIFIKKMLSLGSRVIHNIGTLKINHIIKTLITSYVIILAGWGLISPIIAVFITDNVPNAGVETVGFAMTIYALTRSVIQLPVARHLDNKKGDSDEWYALFFGYIIVGIAALSYLKVNSIMILYIVQIIYGIGDALIYPAWGALFTKHADRSSVATESSLYQTSADIVTALSASLGALLVAKFGYSTVFLIVAITTFMGSFTLIPMFHQLKLKN